MQFFSQLPRHTLEISTGTLAAIPDARLRRLAEYWFARNTGSVIPLRSAIDPLDVPDLLPNIMLIERMMEDGTDRYRFRLAGTDIARHTGRELTGKYIDEILPPAYHDYVRLLNRTALRQRLPVYSSSLYHDEGNFVNGITYRLIVPLRSAAAADDGDMLLACHFWQRRSDPGSWNGDWLSVQPEIRVVTPA